MEFLLTHFQTFEISHLLIMVDRFVLCRCNIAVKCTLGGANKAIIPIIVCLRAAMGRCENLSNSLLKMSKSY